MEGEAREVLLHRVSQKDISSSCNTLCGQRLNAILRKRSLSESQPAHQPDQNIRQYVSSTQIHQPIDSLSDAQDLKIILKHGTLGQRADLHIDGKDIRHFGMNSPRLLDRDHIAETQFMNGTDVKQTITKKQVNNGKSTLVDEEISETGKVARHVYVIYGQAMGTIFAILSIVSLSLGQASVAGSNVWLSLWSASVDSDSDAGPNALSSNSTFGNITLADTLSREAFIAVYGVFGFAQAFFIFIGMLLVMIGCLRACSTLHEGLLGTVVRLPMSFFDTNPSGRIINRFSKEINVLDNILPVNVRSFLSYSTQVVATLVVIVASTPLAAVFVLPVIGIYYFIQVLYVSTSRQLKRIESVSRSPIYSHFSETIQGASIIRAFKRQEEFFADSLTKIDYSIRVSYIIICASRWVGVHLETLGNLITFAAAILAVLARDTISPGIVGLSVTYALSVTMVLNLLVRVASDLEANIVSVERIHEYLQKEQEAKWRVEGKYCAEFWPAKGNVFFNNYEMRYRPGLVLVLRGITCTFKPAEKVGIVGRTGAGKSSLTQALFRLVEAAGGYIEVDDVKIADIGLHDLRSQISIIPQDPVLFGGTLRFNLDPFESRTDADIWKALELAHLSDYVKFQPLGLQHPVDEGGSNFSIGQRQLLCLARALLRQSQILVLDEATAAVDLETDDLIQTTIREQFKDCTILTIAHRLNTIMDYDRVLVLDQGVIAEFDTPASLLSNSGSIFHSMAKDAGLI